MKVHSVGGTHTHTHTHRTHIHTHTHTHTTPHKPFYLNSADFLFLLR